MKVPDRLGADPDWLAFNRERDARILATLSRFHPTTTETLCDALWPGRGATPFTWPTLNGRLRSLARRGLVVYVGPKLWRRSWLR